MSTKAPNFLLVFSDQQRFDALGVHQGWLATPNLDRLAAQGTCFERAYAPTPGCLPSRASTLSGQYSATHGAANNYCYLPQDWDPLVSTTLAAAGYATHLIGKSHLNAMFDPTSPESLPHIADRRFFSDWHGPWYGFERADLCIAHSTEAMAPHMHYGVWLEERGVDIESYFGHTPYEGAGSWALPEEYHSSAWVAETTMAALERRAHDGRPFFIWANFPDPHNPWFVPEPWASMYLGEDTPLPHPRLGDQERAGLAHKPPFYAELLQGPGPWSWRPSDPGLPVLANVTTLDLDDEALARTVASYYAMVSLMDHHLGRILQRLEDLGLAHDTVVVFTSDHGDLLGDHGLWWKGLVAYEESMRVPLVVRAPGRVPPGRRSQALHSLVDLAPTFCQAASVPAPASFEGVSQLGTWEGEGPARQEVLVHERPSFSSWEQRVLVTEEHKVVTYEGRTYGELYDLAADPNQITNLWEDPASAAVRRFLLERLARQPQGHSAPRRSPSLEPGMVADMGGR